MKYCFSAWLVIQVVCFTHGGFRVCAQHLSFDHLTLEEGLSQSTVLAVAQDSEGFMWFGTREGLNRYDARHIKIYRNDPQQKISLSDNFIYSLFSDSKGRLWVGTRTGLNLFDSRTEGFTKFYSYSGETSSLSDNTVTCIMEDRDRNLWIGTRQGLNLLIERDTISFQRFRHQPGNDNSLVNDDIHSIFQDKEGVIWIGTSHGFSRLIYNNPDDYSFTAFGLLDAKGKYTKNNSVNTFAEDAHGRLLIGTERKGLIFFDKQTFQFSDRPVENAKLESKAIRSILRDPGGDFWIGTIGGLFIANHDFSKITAFRNIHDDPSSISDNSIRSLFYDRDGSYWIGTFHGGVNIYSRLARQFKHLMPGVGGEKLRFKVASAITTDKDHNFWIGTEGNGLLFLDRNSNLRIHFKHEETNPNSLCHDNIKCLLLEEDKGIWIGTIKGLDFYDFGQKKFVHFRNDPASNKGLPDDVIYDLIKDVDGKLWIATYFGGLLQVNGERGVVEKVFTNDPENQNTLSSKGITRLFIDSKENLWVGTMSGLNKKRSDGSFSRFLNDPADSTSLSGNYIVSIFEDVENRLWVGTRETGLNLLSEDGKVIRHFSRSDGLPGNTIYAIQEDAHGHLWLSTENGLSRLDTKNFSFRNFNRSDGLLCTQFNFNSYHRDQAGYFYFGGYNGIDYFHPDSIYENKLIPSLAFTGVRLFNKEIKSGDHHNVLQHHVNHEPKLKFRYNQNIFSVEFAVLNYINARKNRFAYKLEGFENEWNVIKEPVATYMNLAPGTYTLLVKGSNNDGFWNDSPKAFAIQVLPPPWKTWWAYAGYLLTFLMLLFTWARLNRKQVKLEHDLQLEHLEKVKQEEFHQAKLNFFTNIAHEIRTPVTLMAAPIDHLLDNPSQNAQVKKELTLVKNNTDRLMRLLNQLLDFQKQETGNVKLKVSQGNIVAFIREMLDSFQEYADSRKVSLNFSITDENILLWFDRDELSKVFFNVLVNALKFTPGGGEVNISVSGNDVVWKHPKALKEEPCVKIIIEDNGLGIAAAHLEKIFHRFYQAENTGIQDAGFGIGLALTKGIIDLHHGNISVESAEATAENSGFTRFTTLLPCGNSHFTKAEIISESDNPIFVDNTDHYGGDPFLLENKEAGEKPLILLVEDNAEIRTYMRDILINHYDVLESKNGLEGLDIAVERLPNLIVSDVMMPVMNGIDLVCKLKTDQRTNHIPIILLTARGTMNHQVEGLKTGADDYLTKPFNTTLLLVKIKNHLAIREKLKEKYSRIVTLQPSHEEVEDPDDRFLQRLMRILEENIMNSEFNVSMLVREIGMSRPVLFRKTKMLTGLSVIDLIRNVRLKKAEMLLKQKKLSISEIAFTVGFSDPKYFSKSFRNQYGKPPSQYIEELDHGLSGSTDCTDLNT